MVLDCVKLTKLIITTGHQDFVFEVQSYSGAPLAKVFCAVVTCFKHSNLWASSLPHSEEALEAAL